MGSNLLGEVIVGREGSIVTDVRQADVLQRRRVRGSRDAVWVRKEGPADALTKFDVHRGRLVKRHE
jgi:hypothetical protein